ncbi:MAG: ribonuclease HII [Betaproteobacteria bacterium]|nr:ribonuclease HII [Betaproteobacteria bacterium]
MTSSLRLVCGVDEAGRGPLAGPVFAASVILGPDAAIEGLADSKTLTAGKRERLALAIKARARDWGIARAEVEEIDALNILQASLLAMRRAVEALKLRPDEVLVDGLHCPEIEFPVRAVVRGDGSVPEIAAASILAKTARDTEMRILHQRFPQYGLDRHKGYPTAAHLAALRRYGVSPIHRRSFAPVRAVLLETGGSE